MIINCRLPKILLLSFSLVQMIFLCACEKGLEENQTITETLLYVVAANGNLRKEGNQKVNVLVQSTPRNIDLYVLKATSRKEGCLFVHRTQFGLDTVWVEDGTRFDQCLKSAVAYLSKRTLPNLSMIIFSHADGWYPSEMLLKSAVIDNYTDLSLKDLYDVLSPLRFRTIAFESCNMGSIEVLSQFYSLCDYLIASSTELLSPGFKPLYEKGTVSLCDKAFVEEFVFSFAEEMDKQEDPLNSYAIAAYQTSKVSELVEAFKSVMESNDVKVDLESVQQLHRSNDDKVYYDFQSYINNTNLSGLKKLEISTLLSEIVVCKYNSKLFLLPYSGFRINEYCGISVFDFANESKYHSQYTSWFNDITFRK